MTDLKCCQLISDRSDDGPHFRWSAIRSVLQPADSTKFLCILDRDYGVIENLGYDHNIELIGNDLAQSRRHWEYGEAPYDFTGAMIGAIERLTKFWPFSAAQLMEELEHGRNSAQLAMGAAYKIERRPQAFSSFVFSKIPGMKNFDNPKWKRGIVRPFRSAFVGFVRARTELMISVRDMTTVPEEQSWDDYTAHGLLNTSLERVIIRRISNGGRVRIVVPYLEWQLIEDWKAYGWVKFHEPIGYSLDASLDLPVPPPPPTPSQSPLPNCRYRELNWDPMKARQPHVITWWSFFNTIRDTAGNVKYPPLSPTRQPSLATKRKPEARDFGLERVQISVQVDRRDEIPDQHRFAPRIPIKSMQGQEHIANITIKDVEFTKRA